MKQGLEALDDQVDGFAGLDHDENLSRPLEEGDELFVGFAHLGFFALGQAVDEFFALFGGAIEDGNGKAVSLDVQSDVATHDFQANHAECLTHT